MFSILSQLVFYLHMVFLKLNQEHEYSVKPHLNKSTKQYSSLPFKMRRYVFMLLYLHIFKSTVVYRGGGVLILFKIIIIIANNL